MKSIHQIAISNLGNIVEDLGTYRPANPRYRELFGAGLILLSEVLDAIKVHETTGNSDILHKDILSALLDFLQRWEGWVKSLSAPDLKHRASKIFHEFLLRYAKGVVKAWRGWRVDLASTLSGPYEPGP